MMLDFYSLYNYQIEIEKTKILFEEFISNENLGKSYIIYINNEIAGYFILTFVFSFEYQGRMAFLDELFITKPNRGKGIGKETIQFIKKMLNELNIKIMYLEVENHNENAQKLYLSNDFKFHNRKILVYNALI